VKRWPLMVLALISAYLLKRYYSGADAESLKWILAPTAWLVGAGYHAPFSFVPGYGYLSRELSFGIIPACAGLNFMIMALGAFMCGILPHVEGWAARARWLAAGVAASYLVTLLANSVRIGIAVWLQLHPVNVDHAQFHRIEGILVYLIFLFAFYSIAQKRVEKYAA
jgi:exosortase K